MAKLSVMRKSYVYADGTVSRSAKADWTALRFDLFGAERKDDKPVVVETVTFDRSAFPADILACAAGHGLMQKLGDEAAGLAEKAKKDGFSFDAERGYADFVRDSLLAPMIDNLTNGVWVEEGEGTSGAGNVVILAEAILRTMAETNPDFVIDDEAKSRMIARLANKEVREGAKARVDVAKHVAAITAERAAERAAKAAEKANAAPVTNGADLGALFAE